MGSHQGGKGGPGSARGSLGGRHAAPARQQTPAWSDRLSAGLLDDLQAWNDSWVSGEDPREDGDVTVRARQEQGRELAIRVQGELGTDGWEVLYRLGDQMFRVHPSGSSRPEPGSRSSSATHRETGRTPKKKAQVLRADHERGRRTACGGLPLPR